jgi:hypothetical protein
LIFINNDIQHKTANIEGFNRDRDKKEKENKQKDEEIKAIQKEIQEIEKNMEKIIVQYELPHQGRGGDSRKEVVTETFTKEAHLVCVCVGGKKKKKKYRCFFVCFGVCVGKRKKNIIVFLCV